MPSFNIYSRLLDIFVNGFVICLRFTLSLKRRKIVLILRIMERLIGNQPYTYKSQKNVIGICCCLSIIIPASTTVYFSSWIVRNFDVFFEEIKIVKKDFINSNKLVTQYILIMLQFSMTLQLFINPSLCIILISFIKYTYAEMYKLSVQNIRNHLRLNFKEEAVKKCIEELHTLILTYRDIEDTISLSSFFAYMMSIMHFFNLVGMIRFYSAIEKMEHFAFYCVFVFIWTLFWFNILILSGNKLSDVTATVHSLRRETVLDVFNTKKTRKSTILYLLTYLECSRVDVSFTLWGLLKMNRELHLNTVGIIISYSVVIATT